MRGSSRFRPHEKLRASDDYQRVKRSGRRARTAHFGVNFAANDLPHHRLGLVVQKRYWNAVGRNRIKRRIREWFRLNKTRIPAPYRDIVVVARPGAEKLSSLDVTKELLAIFLHKDGRIR